MKLCKHGDAERGPPRKPGWRGNCYICHRASQKRNPIPEARQTVYREQRRRWQEKNRARVLAKKRNRAGLPTPTRPCPKRCEACGKTQKHALALDHNHTTGAFRGWLCRRCNRGIGMLGDTTDGIRSALKYMEINHGT